jgi:3-oxoacyl-[acyl-carrier-protein] synthase-3
MNPISIVGAAKYLPKQKIDNHFFEGINDDQIMFKGTQFRYHIEENEQASEMIVNAIKTLKEDLNINLAKEVDILLTNVSINDQPFTGSAAVVAKQLGINPTWMLDIQNTGCISFVYMLDIARHLMLSGAKSAIICNAQSSAGRLFNHPENRKLPQSAIPGDGCGVAYLVANNSSPVLSIVKNSYPEAATDMFLESADNEAWWAPRTTPLNIHFPAEKISKILARGNQIVPEALNSALDKARLKNTDVDALITNQPNLTFLKNWREALEIDEKKHIHSFERHGNLFGAAIPICLAEGIHSARIVSGDHILIGGFSHAGDYAAAAVVHWRGNS